MSNAALVLLLAAFTAISALGQSSGAGTGTGGSASAGGSTGTGGGVSAPGRAPGVSVPSTPSTNSGQAPAIQRTIFITGKVVIEGGSPLPMNVVIQKVCNGNARSVAYADSRGHFSFQWGQTGTFMSDASEAGIANRNSLSGGGGFGSAQSAGGGNPLSSDPFSNQMANCEIRAQLAGYRSEVVSLITRNPMDNPDIGMIVLHRLGNVEGSAVSATSYMAPKDARKAYEKGMQSLLKNKPDDATKEFEKAVLAYPKYAEAWMSLGKARLQQKSFEPAREAMLKAIEADPKLVSPYVELGMMAAQQNKWDEAGPYLDRALRLDPIDFPQAWYVDAAANFNLRKLDAAEKSAREAQKLDPRRSNPRTDYLLGLILAEKHDFTGAAEQFRSYLKNDPNSPEFAKIKDQLGQLERYLAQTSEAAKQQ